MLQTTAAEDVGTKRSDARARTPATSVVNGTRLVSLTAPHNEFWSLEGK